jgi:hypothetical protein
MPITIDRETWPNDAAVKAAGKTLFACRLLAPDGIVRAALKAAIAMAPDAEKMTDAAAINAELLAALKYMVDETDEDFDSVYNPHAAPRARAIAAIKRASEG